MWTNRINVVEGLTNHNQLPRILQRKVMKNILCTKLHKQDFSALVANYFNEKLSRIK